MEEVRKVEATKKPLRDQMPQVAAFLDDLRGAFGDAVINESIRGGMKGKPTFWASEGGVEIGTADRRPAFTVSHDELGNVVYRNLP